MTPLMVLSNLGVVAGVSKKGEDASMHGLGCLGKLGMDTFVQSFLEYGLLSSVQFGSHHFCQTAKNLLLILPEQTENQTEWRNWFTPIWFSSVLGSNG